MNYLVATIKSWNIENFENLKLSHPNDNWHLITDKNDLTPEKVRAINPRYIFFPHWSWIIPAEIFDNFECVVFHMTDLPYGRGGSPLQNLIVRGHKDTKLSAIRVEAGMDTGPIYIKKPLSLEGKAEDIYRRAADLSFDLIKEIIDTNPEPVKQQGEVVEFKRRKPEDGDISKLDDMDKIYDHIRMLDAEGYPRAFTQIGNTRLEFSDAQIKSGQLSAKVNFIKTI
ncbi:MAG: formyltransferase family protein [bacterium]|nr:formyltransferase family protein [bacterium]